MSTLQFPNIPTAPLIELERNGDGHVIDVKISTPWFIWFQQLTQQLQQSFSQEGIGIPSQSKANITGPLTTNQSISKILYNSTDNTFVGCTVDNNQQPIFMKFQLVPI